MIGRLAGVLLEKQAPYLLIDVNGVGYDVQAPMTSIYPLPALGESVVLFTHLSISDNAHQLFAFYTQSERALFRALIKVNGIGPKMAIAILSGITVTDFIHCVNQGDIASLTKVPGVGKKTAQRLVVDIKDRLPQLLEAHPKLSQAADIPQVVTEVVQSAVDDAQSALLALGYKSAQATQMVQVAQKQGGQSSEELIRLALKAG